MQCNPDSKIREIFACRIPNPGSFCLWNPKILGFEIWNSLFFYFSPFFFLTFRKQLTCSPLTSLRKQSTFGDLGSASDWSCRVGNLVQAIRSTTQICVVTRPALVSQTSFRGETSGGVAKCRLFSQANH